MPKEPTRCIIKRTALQGEAEIRPLLNQQSLQGAPADQRHPRLVMLNFKIDEASHTLAPSEGGIAFELYG
jgi:hypothetical protein